MGGKKMYSFMSGKPGGKPGKPVVKKAVKGKKK
jgi:hypothetical protein